MRIGIDIMGGDNAPEEIVKGAINFAKNNPEIKVVVYGDKSKIINNNLENLEIIHTNNYITNEDDPAMAVKTKKDSSMCQGAIDLGLNKIDGFVTAGSTGAAVASAVFLTKRLDNIKKPALGAFLPGNTFILDLGANSDAKVQNLVDQAYIGKVYMEEIKKIKNPKVALLNIGAEKHKGTELLKETYQALENDPNINFVGNIEARYILNNDIDVIICDGYTGNIALKSIEGTAITIFNSLKKVIYQNLLTKMTGLILRNGLKNIKNELDSDEEGGTPIIGINGIMIKAHGHSNAHVIENALKKTKIMIEEDFITILKSKIN